MKHMTFLVLMAITITACIEAPSNGRKEDKDPDNNREPEVNPQVPTTVALESQMFRDPGKSQLSYDDIIQLTIKDELPIGYYPTPKPDQVYEGDIKPTTKQYKTCGTGDQLNSIEARINSCRNAHQENSEESAAYWSAEKSGIAGEADWELAYYDSSTGSELWKNKRTDLVWSHTIGVFDWNEASGYESKENKSICESLNAITGEHLKWRLPNRNEFLMADISGARAVLADTDKTYWTASTIEGDMKVSILQSKGTLGQVDKDVKLNVRCIGVIAK